MAIGGGLIALSSGMASPTGAQDRACSSGGGVEDHIRMNKKSGCHYRKEEWQPLCHLIRAG
jgi:hypothetical protein